MFLKQWQSDSAQLQMRFDGHSYALPFATTALPTQERYLQISVNNHCTSIPRYIVAKGIPIILFSYGLCRDTAKRAPSFFHIASLTFARSIKLL